MDFEVFKALAEAVAIGLLIGSERYKGRDESRQDTAGVRTFAIISLLGAFCSLSGMAGLTLLTFAAVAAYMGIGYYLDPSKKLGLTTEMAALLAFWLGYLVRDYEAPVLSATIVLVILLASKKALHDFVRERVTEVEFFDTLKFLAVVFVVLPLLPDRYMGPFGFFNPDKVWMLIILISAIGYAGYILVRLLGGQQGLTISALLGGVVSTTAVTLALAGRARENPELSKICGVTAVLANAVQFPRLLLLIWVVDVSLGHRLVVPLIGMSLIGFLGALLLAKVGKRSSAVGAVEPVFSNPFSIVPVLKFGLFFAAVLFLSRAAVEYFGTGGIFAVAALSGMGGVSAIGLTLADMVQDGSFSTGAAATALLAAVASNSLVKWILSLINGTRDFAFWLGGGFASILAGGVLLLWLPFG